MATSASIGRSLAYLAVAAGLAGISFRPWFRRTVDGTAPFPLAHHVNAWQGSTLWTFMVALGIAAALLGSVPSSRLGRAYSRMAMSACLLTSTLSACLWARQWWLIDHAPPLRGGVATIVIRSATTADLVPSDPYRIERNRLATYASFNGLGQRAWMTGWSYAALAVVAVLVAGLAAESAAHLRRQRRDTAS